MDDLIYDGGNIIPEEWLFSGEKLVKNNTQGEDVRAAVHGL